MPELERMDIHFRPMTENDLPQVQEIDELSFSAPWPKNSFRVELSHTDLSRLWVAELDALEGEKRIVGIIVVWLIVDEAHIGTIAVHPDCRCRGIARSLIAHALFRAYQDGARKSLLEVRRSNLTAQRLYQQFGFDVTTVRPRYYQDNQEDALLMTLEPIDPDKLLALGRLETHTNK